MKKKFVYLLALIILLILPYTQPYSYLKYSPYIQAEGKIGNQRSIIRPAAVIPLYQRSNILIHLSLIGMTDTTHSLEGNTGIGVRKRFKNNIFGIYVFYDIRKSSKNNIIHQATIGLEWFRNYLEFRTNIYLPKQKFFSTSKPTHISHYKKEGNTIDIQIGTERKIEQALRGFDIDIGSQIPKFERLTIRGAYYYFGINKKHIETRRGFRGIINYQLNKFIQLNLETSYDNQRKLIYFGGITIKYTFDNNKDSPNLTRLERKMNSLPIRDIDAVIGHSIKEDLEATAKIIDINKDTTIIIGDSIDNTLTLIDLTDNGQLIHHISTFNFEDQYISNKIKELCNKNIITDDNIVILFVNENSQFTDINKFNSREPINIVSRIKYSPTTNDTRNFMNLLNVVSRTVENIDIAQEHKNKRINILNQQLNRQQLNIEELQNNINAKQTQLTQQQQENLRLQNSTDNEQNRLQDEINARQLDIEELQRSINVKQTQLTQQQQENLRLQNSTDNEQNRLQDEVNARQLDIEELQRNINIKQTQFTQQQQENLRLQKSTDIEQNRLKKEINIRQLNIDKLQKNLNEKQNHLTQQQQEINQLQQTIIKQSQILKNNNSSENDNEWEKI